MEVAAKERLYNYEVSHPEFGVVTVQTIGPDSATLLAAERWGQKENWKYIVGGMSVRKCGRALEPTCRRCGKRTAEPGLCRDCRAAEEFTRRQMADIQTRDRRAGMRR